MTTFGELFRVFGKIGIVSFGGPAAQIALMHRELVDARSWLTESQFLRALSFCMLLPGPEAMQLATYAGWRLRGMAGGLIAGGLFVLPGALVIAALASAYVTYGATPWVNAAFLGIKAAVVVIVVQALIKVGARALKGPFDWAIAGLAFGAIFVFGLPYPLIILAAALAGAFRARPGERGAQVDLPSPGADHVGTIALWAVLWLFPLTGLLLFAPGLLADIGLFFSKLAVVTFGGAYAVLAYMTQEIVADFGWITTPEMLDALGLAETTPGPLILVTEFVAFLAGYNAAGFPMAFAAALVALWVTFVPCFLWIFAAAPWIEWLTSRPRLEAALGGITAAVVGVIANLSLWFALHVVFRDLTTLEVGPMRFLWPVWSSLDPVALALAVSAGCALFLARIGLIPLLGAAALAGLGIAALA
ncbi:MAG: chromate efflux transporter [Pseudomonadota bacterium]